MPKEKNPLASSGREDPWYHLSSQKTYLPHCAVIGAVPSGHSCAGCSWGAIPFVACCLAAAGNSLKSRANSPFPQSQQSISLTLAGYHSLLSLSIFAPIADEAKKVVIDSRYELDWPDRPVVNSASRPTL